MYQGIITERRVQDKLRERFGRGKVAQVELVEPGAFRARLIDGGLAFATLEEDGSITIQEREAVC